MQLPMFFIAGPTACGKSDFALEIALRCNGEIIGADAFQIYEGMEILTAKPSSKQLSRVPHYLIGSIPRRVSFDVAQYIEAARHAAAEIARRGKLPLVVGGTGLYLRSLMHGLAELPPVNPELRAKLETASLEELQTRLASLDPEASATLDLKNKRRLIRALEVCILTGKPFSSFRQQWEKADAPFNGVCLLRPREELYARIDARTQAMFSAGLLEEVRNLNDLGATASQVLGLQECRACIAGTVSQEQAIDSIQRATRNYAKRQLTWFRREESLKPLDLAQTGWESAVEQTCQLVRENLASA